MGLDDKMANPIKFVKCRCSRRFQALFGGVSSPYSSSAAVDFCSPSAHAPWAD